MTTVWKYVLAQPGDVVSLSAPEANIVDAIIRDAKRAGSIATGAERELRRILESHLLASPETSP